MPLNPNAEVYPGKTLWDLLELIVIPAVLALGVYWLNRQREHIERRIADDRAQEAALRNYLDKMSSLLLDSDLRNLSKSHNLEGTTQIRSVARAQTLTVLKGLNPSRRGSVLRFLYESKLLNAEDTIIDLSDANLSHAELNNTIMAGIRLFSVDLSHAQLFQADLRKASLHKTNLAQAVLSQADLRQTDLSYTNLSNADLREADLRLADLTGANLTGADLTNAKLNDAILVEAILIKAMLKQANLRRSDLTSANLTQGVLSNAILDKAKLINTNLIKADLSGTDLRDVNLPDLLHANLTESISDNTTRWPDNFNVQGAGILNKDQPKFVSKFVKQ